MYSNYKFCDISHHEGKVNVKELAQLGHRLLIVKASDSYFMPDKNGVYDWVNHTDAYFAENYHSARANGLLCIPYHFVRFDRPLPISDRNAIIKANLENFITALATLESKYLGEITTVCIDMEQASTQLTGAGLTQGIVSDMAMKIVDLFLSRFEQALFYSGSWWTDQWLTKAASAYIASKTSCIEPEYVTAILSPDHYNIQEGYSEYVPSPPYGFKKEFAFTADDCIGKLFAHQYTDKGLIPNHTTGFDLNRTQLTKEELYKYLKMDGAVDPPAPPTPLPDDHSDVADAVQEMEETLKNIKVKYGL